MSYVYLLANGNKTYIGATTDPDRRLRQHNGELSGGAKATRGGTWIRVLFISGIPDWTTALQLEWAWKHYTRKIKGRGVSGRIAALCNLFEQPKCTKKSLPYCEWAHPIFLNFSAGQEEILTKIEAWCAGSPSRGPQFRVNNLPSVPQTFLSFKMSVSKTSSSSAASASGELSALIKAITALAEQQATNNKLVTAVLDRLTSGAPAASYGGKPSAPSAASSGEVATKGKRGRKPKADKEPKTKAAPPPAEDGVVRFGSASEGDYKEFSSFFKAPFTVAGKEYISLANYFNSQKFAETDEDFSEDIRTQKNPALTRAKASSVKEHAPRADWDSSRLTVMLDGLRAKFAAHSALAEKLLSTGESPIEATIEEEMRVKGFWSIGEDGSGTNHMGQLLTRLRGELASASGGGTAPKPKPKPAAKPAAPAAKPVAKAKPAPPPADDDSESDTDDEEETPVTLSAKKPVPKVTAVPKKPAAPTPAPASKVEEDDDDSDSDEEDDE